MPKAAPEQRIVVLKVQKNQNRAANENWNEVNETMLDCGVSENLASLIIK